MAVYISKYAHIHVCIYVYRGVYTCIHRYICIQSERESACAYIYTHTSTYVYAYISIHAHACVFENVRVSMCIYICTYMMLRCMPCP